MNPKKFNFTKIDKNSNLAPRVLILSVPAALGFITLTMFDMLTPYWAVVSYAMIVVFNIAF